MYMDFSQGSYFGTSSLFKQQSFDYYGDVYAGARDNDQTDDVICIKISRELYERIPFSERKFMIADDL